MQLQHRNEFPKLMADLNVRTAVEVGVAEAYFAGQLLACTTLERLVLVDIKISAAAKELARRDKRVELVEAPSLDAAIRLDKHFDMVYIDASHEYESVRDDIAAWSLRADKLLAGHDYMPWNPAWPDKCGVMRAVEASVALSHSRVWATGGDGPTLWGRLVAVERAFALKDYGVFGEHLPSWYVIK